VQRSPQRWSPVRMRGVSVPRVSLRRSHLEAAESKRLRLQDQLSGSPLYDIEITSEGLRHLLRLPEKVRAAALEQILGPIVDSP